MKPLHIARTLVLGLTLVASTPITFAATVQTKAADTAVANTHQITKAVTGYYGNIACEQRAMADWTRLTALPDTIEACNTAGEQGAVADPPRHTAPPDPPKAGNTVDAQRAMADWTHVTALPDTTKAGNATSK
ncbi:MAG: hypothetical protein ACREPJ_15985 [Rhodanobacteraceae bacterium]